jgi:inorganic pyrophosphatase
VVEPPRGVVDVLIESPRFSHIKRRNDGRIDFVSPLPCPFNYGCVPNSVSGDGDPIDVVLLGATLPRGARMRVRVLAVVDFADAGEPDPKWVCGEPPLSARDRLSVIVFFHVYAVAKGALNRIRRKRGTTVFRGLREL